MIDALGWLVAVEILGLLALPISFLLFQRLPDRGFTLAKPLGLVLFSYVLWLAGLTHMVPNSRITIAVILGIGAIVAGLALRSAAPAFKSFLKDEWRTLLAAEAVFLVFFLLWLGIASESPAINHTEKPMDFGFMNAVLQSRFFPPEDPWLAGHSISYYYFGHFMMAFLTKLTAIPSSVSYNLALSLVPALVGIGAFGLLYNLVRLSGGGRGTAVGFGLAGPALVMLAGNLEGALEFVHAQGWGSAGFWDWVGIKGLEGGRAASSGAFPDQPWWWWRATRVIDTLVDGQSLDYTITEFPAFSFILGDLHPHMMSLPFLLLGLSLGLNLFRSPDPLGPAWLRRHPLESAAIGLFIGCLGFINTWDLPLMAGVLAALALVKSYGEQRGNLQRAAMNTVVVLAPILAASVVLFLPFYLALSGQASGVLPLRGVSTRPFLFFLAMGLFTYLGISFVLRQLSGLARPAKEDAPAAVLALGIALTPMLVWGLTVLSWTLASDGAAAALGKVGSRMWVLAGLAIVGLAAFSAAQRVRLGREPVAAFSLVLLAAGFYLLAGAELFYVVDFFGGPYRRMNTVFKVYYQAWLLLALAATYGLYYWQSHRPRSRPQPGRLPSRGAALFRAGHYVWAGLVAALLVVSFYYPVGAVLDRTGVLGPNHTFKDNTLDGLEFLRGANPGEYAAIQWLRDQAPWGRIVEAVGGDYSDYGRISASTGLPTVLGWKGHELQWRGGSKLFSGREEDVAQIYRSGDPERVRQLLQWYDVRYVYFGHRERADYGGANLAAFGSFLRTAFQQDGVVIYELTDGTGQHIAADDGRDPG